MPYNLEFKKTALKEWQKLGATVRQQFTRKLRERLENPRVQADKLSGAEEIYKIKLRQSGYRLVYQVEQQTITVVVVAVGRRERSNVYKNALKRLND